MDKHGNCSVLIVVRADDVDVGTNDDMDVDVDVVVDVDVNTVAGQS